MARSIDRVNRRLDRHYGVSNKMLFLTTIVGRTERVTCSQNTAQNGMALVSSLTLH